MTTEEAAMILDPETSRDALWKYEEAERLKACNEACRLGAAALRALQQPNAPLTGWISVKDRLPDKQGRCIVYDEILGVQVYHYHPDMFCPGWNTVTHWMPLPDPPEEGTR